MDLKSWNYYLEELVGAVERRRPVDPSQDPQFIDVKGLIKQQKTLDPQLWESEKLKPEIVDRLIKIARKFFKSLDIGPITIIKDITLTGSLASYNWSDYSDVDLHILLDFTQFENSDLIKDLVRNAASNWNNKHDIKMKGYEVEMYVQDANEPHHALGVYSLLNNRFLKTPQKFTRKIDSEAVKEKANDLMEKIDDIYDNYAEQQYSLAEKRAEYIINKIRNYRKAGLEQDGPYSIENLVFKVLRRNGYLKKVIDLRTNSYDKRMSVNYNGKLYEVIGINIKKNRNDTLRDLKSLPVKNGIVNAIDYAQLKHRKRKSPPRYIVIHHSTTGSPAGTLHSWPPRGKRGASTHFEIDKDGTIYQYLDPATQIGIHASRSPVNSDSIGIDLTGNFKADPLTDEEALRSPQFRSLRRLVQSLKSQFNIPDGVFTRGVRGKKLTTSQIISNGYGVVGHGHVHATSCPGNLPSYFHLLGKPSVDFVNTDNKISPKEIKKSVKNIIISGNSHMGGTFFKNLDRYYKDLSKKTGHVYHFLRIDAPFGSGGEVEALNRKINILAQKLGGRPVDTIIHFGTNKSPKTQELLTKYRRLSNDVYVVGTPEAKKSYKYYDRRVKWNEELKKIIAGMGPGITYYDTFGLTTQKDLTDSVHLRPSAYRTIFSSFINQFNVDQPIGGRDTTIVSPGGVYTTRWNKNRNDINLPSQETLYTNSIYKNAGGGGYGIRKNTFLSKFKHLDGKLIPGIFESFDKFYQALQTTFGKNWLSLLPVHGRDYIFGPEHFSAALKLANTINSEKLKDLLKSKSFKKSDVATKKALKRSIKRSDKVFTAPSGERVTRRTVQKDVLKAAEDMNASAFETRLLLKFLDIETGGGNPVHTFYNPEVAKYRGKVNRPHAVDGNVRLIGPFQILRKYEKGYEKNYGYDTKQFGDPYHQAGVVINFIRAMKRKFGESPTIIYMSWNQGGRGTRTIYNAFKKDPDTPIDKNKYIPDDIASNMKNNYAGSMPITPRKFIERYGKAKGLDKV